MKNHKLDWGRAALNVCANVAMVAAAVAVFALALKFSLPVGAMLGTKLLGTAAHPGALVMLGAVLSYGLHLMNKLPLYSMRPQKRAATAVINNTP